MILFIMFFAREKMLDEVMRCQFTREEVFGEEAGEVDAHTDADGAGRV